MEDNDFDLCWSENEVITHIMKSKVNFTLEKAAKAKRRSRGIALLFP
jgi:hypothetical protein